MTVIHSNDVPDSSLLGSDNQELNAGGLCTIQDLEVGDIGLPTKAWDGEESMQVKFLQFLDALLTQSPGLTTIEREGITTAL